MPVLHRDELHHGLYGLMEFAFGNDGFNPFFCHPFDFADFTDKGMRPSWALKRPSPLAVKEQSL